MVVLQQADELGAARLVDVGELSGPLGAYYLLCEVVWEETGMLGFLLWLILLVLCWPLALLALVLYPVVWLLLLPFRIVGIAVDGVLQLIWAIVTLPARVLRGPRHA